LSHERNRFDLLNHIDAVIGGPPHDGLQIAVLVIVAATPNQYEGLVRMLGQAAADSFANASATSMGACLPAHAELYRLTAAQFGCVLEVGPPDRVEEIVDGLAYRIRRPGPAGPSMPMATSIGIGVACYPHHGANPADLLQAAVSSAHESLYGGAPWRSYSPEADQASLRAACLLRDIVPALAGQGQLRLVYQPKTELSTGRCIGAEALLRWNHPTLGPIPPDEFVPLVERTVLMNAMTDWALGTALSQVARWQAAGIEPLISINVSMQDLLGDRFAARLAGMLEHHTVRPDRVHIEITESALMKDPVRVRRQFDEIRRQGIAIEIDDYGTGLSGLSYLKSIPASYVKIDQSFVSRLAEDRTDQIIVGSTIDLAHDLGLRVVAEGIRDEAALDWLREHGCDIGQGNLLSPPLEAPDFEKFLRTSRQPVPF